MVEDEIVSIVLEYTESIKDYFNINKIILYGSYANDRPRPHSDIDIAVVVDKIEGSLLEAEFLLHKLARNVDLRLEPVLYEEGNDPGGFLEEISKTGIEVYSNS